MLRRKFPGLLLIAVIWLVAVAILLELALRGFSAVLPPHLQAAANTVMHGVPFAEPWDRAWIRNPDHYFILKPGLVDAVQFGSAQVRFHVSTVELWEGGGIGFRNRPVTYFVDAVVVGDSFAFCFTEAADCWVTQLETDSGKGLVNLGLPVTGSRSHLLALRDFGRHYTPPLVIWQFFGNDFNEDYGLLESRDEIEPLKDAEQDEMEADNNEPQGLIKWLRGNSVLYVVADIVLSGQRWLLDPSAEQFDERHEVTLSGGDRLRFGQPYETQALDMTRPINQAGLEISRDAFKEAKALTASWGGELAVVIVPTREEVYESSTAPAMGAELDAHRSARHAMLGICDELELRCFDALKGLQAHTAAGELLYYADDLHLNPLGNRAFADIVGRWLIEEELWAD